MLWYDVLLDAQAVPAEEPTTGMLAEETTTGIGRMRSRASPYATGPLATSFWLSDASKVGLSDAMVGVGNYHSWTTSAQ